MVSIVTLYALATLDATFCGFRAAAGRNALIDKRAYYRRAMRVGFISGQAAILTLLLLALAMWSVAPDRTALAEDYQIAARALLTIYLPYTLVLVAAFAVNRALRSVDLRSIMSVVIFGPGTFVRPLVATVGMIYALILVPRAPVIATGSLGLVTLLSFETLLSRPAILAKITSTSA